MNNSLKPNILVAIPAHNGAGYIGDVITQASHYAGVVLVVDDGSTDNTADIVRSTNATLVQRHKRQGKGSAIQIILDEARKRKSDILVLMDADLQHNPDEIPKLIKPILEGYDLVLGCRHLKTNKTSLYQQFGQLILGYMSQYLAGRKITDPECGFRALSKKAVSELNLKEKGYALKTEMIAEAVERKLRITEVPVSTIYNEDGSICNPSEHGFEVFLRILVMIFRKKPYLLFWVILYLIIDILIIWLIVN